jgi:hypothetical protein
VDYYKGAIPILDPDTPEGRDYLFPKGAVFGAVPRDYSIDPPTMKADPRGMATIARGDWDAYYDEQEAQESSLEHLFLRGGKPAFVNLNQGRDGDCWAYSTGHAMMLAALRDGRVPVARLNPHFIAAHLKRFDGGWCGASAKVVREVGCCEEGAGPDKWPLHSHDTRLLTPERLAAAGSHKSLEDWYDMARAEWDQEMRTELLATCGLTNVPCPSDFNFMSHSVCQVRWVRFEAGDWGPLYLNSWLNFGRFGLATLRGRQATADGAVGVRVAK